MKEITVKVKIHNPEDIDDETVVANINNAIGFAENDGMWPYGHWYEVETV